MKQFYLCFYSLLATLFLMISPCYSESQKEESSYKHFLKTDEWKSFFEPATESSLHSLDNYQIEQYKIFDLNNDGNLELWFCASEKNSSKGMHGYKDCVSAVATLNNGKIQKLLTAHMTSGSIGGEVVKIVYDSKNKTHCFSIFGFIGGDGNNRFWNTYYELKDSSLSSFLKIYTRTNLASGKTNYKINDHPVNEKLYNEAYSRFTPPKNQALNLDYL